MTSDTDDHPGSNPRQAAARRSRLESFGEDGAPPPGTNCDLLCEDHVGTYQVPYPCVWDGCLWRSADTGEPIEARVVRWRPSGGARQRTRRG
jgi:hypothetical protein